MSNTSAVAQEQTLHRGSFRSDRLFLVSPGLLNLPAAKWLAPGKGEGHRLPPPQDDKQFHSLSESRTGSYPGRRVARTAGARCVGSNESVPDSAEVAGRHGYCFNHWRYLLISITCLRTSAQVFRGHSRAGAYHNKRSTACLR